MLDVFDHVTIRVSDLEASSRFYEQALAQLGYGEPFRGDFRGDQFLEWEDLSIGAAGDGRAATRNLHLALVARSQWDRSGHTTGSALEGCSRHAIATSALHSTPCTS